MSLLIVKSGYHYITETSSPPGYSVSIPHPERPEKYVRKNFFGKSKSLNEYLEDAIKWRDAKYFALYKEVAPGRFFHRQQKNSHTETPSVRRVEKIVKKKLKDGSVARYRVPCIVAEIWTQPGRGYTRPKGSKSKVYSIQKYGEAFRLAREWRKKMESSLAHIEQPEN